MITAIWRKHWMELWGRWAFLTAFALLPGIAVALAATGRRASHPPDTGGFLLFFAAVVLGLFPTQFGGTGLGASRGARARRGTDPSLLFTLSLPVRRRTLFFHRSVSGLLAMESAAASAWAIDSLLLVQVGASWHALVPVLWVLPVLVPFYFLDSLLLIRFSQMTTVQLQGLTIMIVWFVQQWLGNPLVKMAGAALHHFTLLPVALAVCVISLAFAATTVWRLDRQNY